MKTIGWIAALGLMASNGKVVNFDTYTLGRAPAGWTVAMTNHGGPPKWEIRKDQSAPTQPYVLAQVSNDAYKFRSPLAILDTPALRDGDVSVRLKPVAGNTDRGGGVVWRYQDANNYYVAVADALQQNVAVYKVQDGRAIPINFGVKHLIPSNAWCILKVSARGNRFQVYLDHRRILQGQDATFAAAGKVGLRTAADAVTYFDDFRVYPK